MEEEFVVIPRVLKTSVYENTLGEIVIAQEAPYEEIDEVYIVIPKSHVEILIAALKEAC